MFITNLGFYLFLALTGKLSRYLLMSIVHLDNYKIEYVKIKISDFQRNKNQKHKKWLLW